MVSEVLDQCSNKADYAECHFAECHCAIHPSKSIFIGRKIYPSLSNNVPLLNLPQICFLGSTPFCQTDISSTSHSVYKPTRLPKTGTTINTAHPYTALITFKLTT